MIINLQIARFQNEVGLLIYNRFCAILKQTKKEGRIMRQTRLRFLLDTIFKCKKLAAILPIITALIFGILAYFLSDSFGADINNLWLLPLYMLCAFLITFLLLFGIMSIRMCPGWYVDTVELLIILGTGISAITQIITFFTDFQTFSTSMPICITCYSAVSVAHNRRNIYKD